MKLLFLLAAFPLLLFSSLLGKVTSYPSPTVLLSLSSDVVKDEERASSSLEKLQHQKPVQDPSWISMYTPVKSCHTELREKQGEFSPPSFPNAFEGSIWCNWTIWAGSRKHIVIYIKGFQSRESCDVNSDKIFFLGVSSLAENAVIFACWQKEVHVFATYAEGVHVVLLVRLTAHSRKEGLVGKYYIFKHREIKPPLEDLIGSSELLSPELSLSIFTSLPQSQKELFVLMWDSANASLSSSLRTYKVTELSPSSQARRDDARFVYLPSFVRQVTSSEHLTPENLSLLSMSSTDSEKFPYIPETSTEMKYHTSWGHLGESAIPLDFLSYIPYLSSSPLIKPSSPPEGLPSTSLGPIIGNDPHMGSISTQMDYLATYSLAVSCSSEATTDVNGEVLHLSFKEGVSTDFQTSMPVPEMVSRDAPGFETAMPFRPEHNWVGTEMQEDNLLLFSSETPGRGKFGRQAGGPVLLFGSHRCMSEWENKTAPIPKETTMLLDTRPILESITPVTELLKTTLDITVLCGLLWGSLPLRTRSSSHEAFGTIVNFLPAATESISCMDVSLDLTTEMLGESGEINWEEQSSHFWDTVAHPELPFSPEATVAPTISTEPGLYISSQDHDLFSRVKAILSFPAMELEPSLSPSAEGILLRAFPDLGPTPSAVDPTLSPSMALTYLFSSVEPDQTVSLPGLRSLVLSETALALSSAVESLGPTPAGLDRAYSETAAILLTAAELETVLSPSLTLLNLAASPTTPVNFLATEQIMPAFSPVNGITPSIGLLMTKAIETVDSLSSCCQRAVRTSEQGELLLLTAWSSGWMDPVVGDLSQSVSTTLAAEELEHLFPATEMSLTKQQLLEGKHNHPFLTVPEEENEWIVFSDMIKYLNLVSQTELFPSLSGFIAHRFSPQNESVTETPLLFVPVTGEEESIMNCTFISSTALTSVLSHTEMQTPFPRCLTSVDNATGLPPQPQVSWEIQPGAEWQKAALEVPVSSLNVLGTLVKNPTTDLQPPRVPSDIENKVVSKVLWDDIELGFPWLMVYLPVKSCHITLNEEAGTFSPPTFSHIQTNHWCNWTIWAGPHKHILIYIEGFEGKLDCEENQDKILFQGVRSSVENRVTYACRNHGTLTFATQAEAAHVVFLSKASSQSHGHKYFKGRYYIFEDYEMSASAVGDMASPEQPVLKYNSSIGFLSYIMHSRHTSAFETRGMVPSNENSLPKERRNKTKNATSPEALLRPAAGNCTSAPFPEATKNITRQDLDMKKVQVIKPSVDEHQVGNETFSGRLKKTGVPDSNGMGIKKKASFSSSTPYDSQKFKMRTTLVVPRITTEPLGAENNVHWRPTHMKDAGRAKFEQSDFLSRGPFPQVSFKEWIPPVLPPKSIPEEMQQRALWPLQSHAETSTKASDAVERQPVELKEAPRGERMVVIPGNLKNTQAGMAVTSHPENSVAGYMGCLQRKCTKSNPLYFPLSSYETPLNQGQANNSHDSILVFRSPENDSVLVSHHKPGDILLEVTFGIEHKEQIHHNGSELEKDFIESVKMQVEERVKFLSNKVKEIKLKEIRRKEGSERKRMNDPHLLFTFWLHLVPEEKNISRLIHSHLEGLGGTSTGSGEIRQVSVGDVNECNSGIGLCGDEAICLNGYGTYLCQCKEEYEDRSLTKSGTLCVRSPPSGLRFLYNYMEIFVGTMIFFISVIVVVISVLCTIVKKRRTKKDLSFAEAALSRTSAAPHSPSATFDQNNVHNLLTLDPARLKLRAKSPEWPLQLRSSPTEVCRVSIEQSECL